MKNYRKKGLSLFLTFVLTFALCGCGNLSASGNEKAKMGEAVESENLENTESKAMGRYVERLSEVNYNVGRIGDIKKMDDGSWAFLDLSALKLVKSVDEGQHWEGEYIPEAESLVDNQNLEFFSGDIAPDGSIFYCYNDWSEVSGHFDSEESASDTMTNRPTHYIYIDAEGKKTECNIDVGKENESFEKMVYTSTGRLFGLCYDGGVYEVDVQNQSISQVFFMTGNSYMALWAGGNSLVGCDGEKVYIYSMEDGSLEESDSVLNDYIHKETEGFNTVEITLDEKDKTIYIASAKGLFAHVIGGSVMEQMIDGQLCNLGDPANSINTLCMLGEMSFAMGYSSGEIDTYVYDPNMSTVPDQQVNLFSLQDSPTLRQAITAFRKQNPDVYVKLELGITDEGGMTEEDAIRNLNTRLLAGEGPDMIVMDGMPLDSFIEKGMLLDIRDTIAKSAESTTYFDKMLYAYKQDDQALYAVPVRCNIPILVGDSTDLNNINDLSSLADTVENIEASGRVDAMLFGNYNAAELLDRLYMSYSSALVKDGTIDKDVLTKFLTEAKRIYDVDSKYIPEKLKQEHFEWLDGGTIKDPKSEDIILGASNQAFNIAMKEQCLGAGYVKEMHDLESIVSVPPMIDGFTSKQYSLQDANVFIPKLITGINSNSKNQELAKSFLVTMLSPTVQCQPLQDGFPMNKQAYADYCTNPYPEYTSCGGKQNIFGEDICIEMLWPNEKELADFQAIMESLDTPCLMDDTIKNTVIDNGVIALERDSSIEDSVNQIMQKMTIYSQE